MGRKFPGSVDAPDLCIRIVRPSFQISGKVEVLQQWLMICHKCVRKAGQCFKGIMLTWSKGQGEPLDLTFLIIVVISL